MIPVGILTYRRPHFFRQTLESFIRLNYACLDRFTLLLLVQDVDDETEKVIETFKEYLHEVFYQENKGCAAGYSEIMQICLSYNTPLVMHLQDDWLSTEPLTHYLGLIETMFEIKRGIGYIRLRSIKEHVSKQNRLSKELIGCPHCPGGSRPRSPVFGDDEVNLKRMGKFTPYDEPYSMCRADIRGTVHQARLHWTFNPTIIRSDVLTPLLPFTKELDAMRKFHETGLNGAQLNANCFRHIGLKRAMTVNEKGQEVWVN